jgi:hypothetical protein
MLKRIGILKVKHIQTTNAFAGLEVLTEVVMKSTIFWDITPCSPLKVNQRFGGTYRLQLQGRISQATCQSESRCQAFTLVSWSTYATLKMEAICFSETSADFQRTTRRVISL